MSPSKPIAIPVNPRARRTRSSVATPVLRQNEPGAEADASGAAPGPRAGSEPGHRYRVGERLRMANGGRAFARAEAYCRVVSRLPYEGHGPLLYRVRSETEQFERVVAEIDLSRTAQADP
jgi:hypothetical protein